LNYLKAPINAGGGHGSLGALSLGYDVVYQLQGEASWYVRTVVILAPIRIGHYREVIHYMVVQVIWVITNADRHGERS